LRYHIADQCLFSDDGGTSTLLNLMGQLGDRAYWIAGELAPLQEPCNELTVPACRGEYDGAAICGLPLSLREAGARRYGTCLRGVAVLR
jgi:hypothetical protein